MMWTWINRCFDRLVKLPLVPFSLLGCGVGRTWLGWVLYAICNTDTLPMLAARQGHLVFDIGEILGFFGLALVSARMGFCHRKTPVLATGPLLMTLVTLLVIGYATLPLPDPLVVACIVAGGVGYAFNLLCWLEVFGTLPARRMLIAWSGSYLFTLCIWLLYSNMDERAATLLMLALPFVCLVLLAVSSRAITLPEKPDAPTSTSQIPWKYVVAITVFVFAIGVADSVSGRPIFSDSSRLGMSVTEAVVLIGALFFPEKSDLAKLLTAAPVVMVVGVFASFTVAQDVPAAAALLTIASELCLVLSYTVGCTLAHRMCASSMLVCGILAGLNKLVLQLGKWSCALFLNLSGQSPVAHWTVCAATIAVTVIAAAVLSRDPDLIERINWNQARVSARNMGYARIVDECALTPREASILLMVSQGADTAQIADELFCAQSTVRVHMSNLYKKLGVHSRAELLATYQGLQG